MDQRTYISCPYLQGPFCRRRGNKGTVIEQKEGQTVVILGQCSEENCPLETLIVEDNGEMKFETPPFKEETDEIP